MKFEGFSTLKTKEILDNQVSDVSSKLENANINIPSKDLSEISLEEIKKQYPERYTIYLKILRAQKNNQEIEPKELDQMKDWIHALNNLDAYITKHNNNEKAGTRLRGRQINIFEDTRNSLEQGKREGYIKLPTGVGKTILFTQIVESLGLKTLIVVPSKVLLNQTGEKLEKFTDVEFGKYYQKIKDSSKSVTVITYQSLMRGIESETIKPKEYGVLILDEVHKGLGEKTAEAIKKFSGIKLGFTATPEYSKDKHVGDLLEHEIHSMSIMEAARENLILRPKPIYAFTETDISDVKVTSSGDYDEKELEKAVNNEARNLSAMQLYQEMFFGRSAIAYCSGVAHAESLNKLFNEQGISSAVISGTTPEEERGDIFKKFKNGEIKVLCNARVLIEGFDEPRASVGLNLQPTLSKVDAEQRGGRLLRINDIDPFKVPYIVDFIDTNRNSSSITFPDILKYSGATEQDLEEIQKENLLDSDKKKMSDSDNTNDSYINEKLINIQGLRVVVNIKEIFNIQGDFELSKDKITFTFPPEGWRTASSLRKEVKTLPETVKKFAEQYRESRPAWFKVFKTSSGTSVAEHYSNELVEIIKKEFNKQDAIDGWKTASSLLGELKTSGPVIKKFVEPYRLSNPEWFRAFMAGPVQREHYSPGLVGILTKELTIPETPTGWLSVTSILEHVPVGRSVIRKFAEQYRESNPNWFKDFRVESSKIEHYSPELINLIIENFSSTSKALEGWLTGSSLQKEINVSQVTIKKFAESYRTSNPEWFRDFKPYAGYLNAEHYSPVLIKIIKETFIEAPEGWLQVSVLSDENRTYPLAIRNFAEKFRQSNPEWFKKFKGPRSGIIEHYSPELVKIIREHVF